VAGCLECALRPALDATRRRARLSDPSREANVGSRSEATNHARQQGSAWDIPARGAVPHESAFFDEKGVFA
jgi:hypothetical protein